jgi:hypothetical protein
MKEIAISAGSIVAITAFCLKAKAIWGKVYGIVKPLVEEAEELAKDGKIDKSDRKKLVMSAIDKFILAGSFKPNFIIKALLPWIVDKIAEALPDFTFNKGVTPIKGAV